MDIVDFKCNTCGQEKARVVFDDEKPCYDNLCCDCCKRQGLQSAKCKMALLELDRLAKGKALNRNDFVGLLLEMAMSDALKTLGIPHKHNPFTNVYPCYQVNNPDIVIEKLDIVIECKNLSEKQVKHLTRKWLDGNIIDRPYASKYRRKFVLFSYKPRLSLIRYLNLHHWRVYGVGSQILTYRQERKAIPKLIRQFYWLRKEYDQTQEPIPKKQTRLKLAYLPESTLHSIP